MSDDANQPFQNEITARLVAEAEATITREMAEFVRIAFKYNIDADAYNSIIGGAKPQPQQTPKGQPHFPWAPVAPAYDGTFRGLMDCYRTHEKSPFRELKHSVSINYGRALKRLAKDIGDDRVGDWSADIVQSHYNRWAAGDKIAIGHDMIGKIRLLCGFGTTVLNDAACIKLSTILSKMRFPVSKGGKILRLTRDQTRAIRITAREHFGWDSIALAVALQLEIPKLRQVDVIGEWVPIGDAAKSEIMKGEEKWVRGLRWSDIDDNMVLRRALTSGRREEHKEIKYSLKRAQMIMEEINRVPLAKRVGPMIICEFSNLPWSQFEFRRKLKIVAEKAGISLRPQSTEGHEESELEAETAS
jgi:hypothetical protein